MLFTLDEVDMNCGISNPGVALAIAMSALSFGTLMALTFVSTRSYSRKALLLALVFASSTLHSRLLQVLALWTQASMDSLSFPGSVGCIGGAPPALLGQSATLISALVVWTAWWLWRRMHSLRQARARS